MNKNMMWVVVFIALIVGGIIGYSIEKTKAASQMAMQRANMQKQIDDAKMMAKKGTGTNVMHPTEAMMGGNDTMMKKQEGIMMMTMQDATSLKGTLSDVSGATGTGKAFVLRKDGKLDFTVSATLPDPANGSFYEGWLVKKGSSPVQLVDTGMLTKQKDNSYEVSYASDTNTYDGYNFVVITWEQGKVDPANPGKHILEGTVQ